MQMPTNSGKTSADMHLRFCRTWLSYARWGEALVRQAADQSAEVDRDADYKAVEQIVKAFRALVKAEGVHLAGLLKASDFKLAPFSDPFRLPISGLRWLDLQREREESYSDWLAWLLAGMDSAEQVLKLFGLEDTKFGSLASKEKPTIDREVGYRASGGELKRLDIVIRFADAGILLVEVKIREISVAGGAENLPDYLSWLEKHQPDPRRRCAILLIPNPIEPPSGWEVRSWDGVSLKLRLQATVCDASIPGSRLFAAMLLCFAGAVEQNVLGLNGREATISAPQTALYLERFLQGGQL
jgi:hypothetical protein